MAVRFALACLAAVLIFQIFYTNALVVRRDTNQKTAQETVDEALTNLKTGFDDLLKNIQDNELFQNVSDTLKTFGETVQKQGQDLVKKIKEKTEEARSDTDVQIVRLTWV